jgi:hypothetical protein
MTAEGTVGAPTCLYGKHFFLVNVKERAFCSLGQKIVKSFHKCSVTGPNCIVDIIISVFKPLMIQYRLENYINCQFYKINLLFFSKI